MGKNNDSPKSINKQIFCDLNSKKNINSENLNSKKPNNSREVNTNEIKNRSGEINRSEMASTFGEMSQLNRIPTIKNLVEEGVRIKASDLHIRVGQKPRFRVQGELIILKGYVKITREIFASFLEEILTLSQRKILAQTKELDTSIFYSGLVRCRVNCFDTFTGGGIVLRLISLSIPSIDELGLPEILKKIVSKTQGLILVTGATNTGKTTTVAAMIRHINENFYKHIITIEDPICFVHYSMKSLVTQREIGLNTNNFNQALKSALREDPDVIMIEELRDKITVETVLQAAQTGHLVLATLHTRNALNAIDRIINLYNPESQYPIKIQLMESLIAVISQKLVKTIHNRLIPINDILINTPTMQDYLLKNNKEKALQLMENDLNGMQTMNEVIYEELLTGRIKLNEGLRVSPDPEELERRIRTRGLECQGHSSAREWMSMEGQSTRDKGQRKF